MDKHATLVVLPELIARGVLPLLPRDVASCGLFCCCLMPYWFSSAPGACGQAPAAAQHYLIPITHARTRSCLNYDSQRPFILQRQKLTTSNGCLYL